MTDFSQINLDGSMGPVNNSHGIWTEQPSEDELEALPEGLQAMMEARQSANERAGLPDFAAYRMESCDSWTEIVDGSTFPEQLLSLLKQVLLLPRADFQIPIAASYLMLCSPLCQRSPILFSHGLSGSGKSSLGYVACRIHNRPSISAGSTAVSLRNDIQNGRWYDVELGDVAGNEKPWVLVWEDINEAELRRYDGMILSILKNGVERTGVVTIASLGGTNVSFYVFSPKYISSIHPLYSLYEFRELIRRVVVIQHKPFDKWDKDDHSEFYSDVNPNDLIDISELDTDGMNDEYLGFWKNLDNLRYYSEVRRSLSKTRKHGIPDAYYKMSIDLMTTGVVCGYFKNKEAAIEHMRLYWQWHENNIASQMGATQKVLKRFLSERTESIEATNKRFRDAGMEFACQPLTVDPKELKSYISQCAANGELDTNTNPKEIVACMAGLGWKLEETSAGKMMWTTMVV